MPITVDLSVVISTLMGCIVYPQSHKWYSRNDWIQQLASKFTEMYSGMNTAAIKCNFTEIQSSKNRRIPCSDAQIEEILPYIDDIADVIANLTSIFATPSVLANLIDIDSRLVPIVLYPTLPDNKRCALHGLALTNKNKPSAPFAVRVVHTMDGAFVGVSLTYSCSDTKSPCVYEYGRRYENGLAFYDIDSIRDETYDYFLSSERAIYSKQFVRYTLAQWMEGVPFSRQATMYNQVNYAAHTKRREDWKASAHKIGSKEVSLALNDERLIEMFHLYTLAKVCFLCIKVF
eukprot:715774_1